MVSATGGSPQIIQTHSGSQMTTTMAGAGGNNNLDLLKYSSGTHEIVCPKNNKSGN